MIYGAIWMWFILTDLAVAFVAIDIRSTPAGLQTIRNGLLAGAGQDGRLAEVATKRIVFLLGAASPETAT